MAEKRPWRKTAAGRRHRRPAAPLYNHSVMKSVRQKIGQCVRLSDPWPVLPKRFCCHLPPWGVAFAAIFSCATLSASLASVNQPEVPPPRRSPHPINRLQPVEGRGLFRVFRAVEDYELVPIRKYRVRVRATSIVTSVPLQLHGCAQPRARVGHA
jgi:hypothetical protein